jgi:uncharacterized coiled-coil DUF342 family protein
VKKIRDDALKHRSDRDKINEKVAELKENLKPLFDELDKKRVRHRRSERNVQNNINGLPPRRKVEEQLRRIEWKLMTTPTKEMLDKERRFIERAEELRKILEQYYALNGKNDEDSSLLNEIKVLETEIRIIKDSVSALASDSQKHHEMMIKLYKKADEERGEANLTHRDYVKTLEKIREVNSSMDQMMSEIKALREELDVKDRRIIARRSADDRVKIDKLRERAQKSWKPERN